MAGPVSCKRCVDCSAHSGFDTCCSAYRQPSHSAGKAVASQLALHRWQDSFDYAVAPPGSSWDPDSTEIAKTLAPEFVPRKLSPKNLTPPAYRQISGAE